MTLDEMRQGALDANWGPRKCAVLEAYLADFSDYFRGCRINDGIAMRSSLSRLKSSAVA
jgi:hypothetical protein